MIYKHPNYNNGYVFAKSSTDKDFQKIVDDYNKTKKGFRCIICNNLTARNFKTEGGYANITINNRISDGCFFVNVCN